MKNIINREMTGMKHTAQWPFLLAGTGITLALMTQRNAVTLDRIQSSNVFSVGYRQLPPFSSTDHNSKVTGYIIVVYNMIANKLRQYLKLNSLTVHCIPINFAERFSALNSCEVDMNCGVSTSAPEQTASVSFSENYYTAKVRIISLRKNSIRSVSDLKSRMVSLTGSSKDLLEFNKANRGQHLNISTIISTTIKGAFEKIAHNESAAFFIGDILAWPLTNHNEQPELFSVSSESIGNGMCCAIMMRKNNQQFVTFVDSTLKGFFVSPANVQLRKRQLSPWSYKELKDPSPGSYQYNH